MNLICSFSNEKIEKNETCFIFFIEQQDVLKSGTSLDPYDYFKHIDNDVLFIEGSYNGYGSFTVNDKTKLDSLVNSINNILSNDALFNTTTVNHNIESDDGYDIINIDDNISNNKLNWDNICENSYTGFLNNISMFVVKKDTCFKTISNLKNKFIKDINLIYKDKNKSIESRLISIENMLPESINDIFLKDINVNHIAEKLAFHKYMVDNNIRVFPSISS